MFLNLIVLIIQWVRQILVNSHTNKCETATLVNASKVITWRKPGGGPCESDDVLSLEDEGFNQEKGERDLSMDGDRLCKGPVAKGRKHPTPKEDTSGWATTIHVENKAK